MSDHLFDLERYDAEELDRKVQVSIAILKTYEPEGEYFGAFSGGKDSCVIKELARLAGVRAKWHYSVTTIDPPELVQFIRKKHPDVVFLRPKYGNFFERAKTKGFPTRKSRWCCADYKEMSSPIGSTTILGVRATESPRRSSGWKTVSRHSRTRSSIICPILDWCDRDVWSFIKSRAVPYCSLYDEGFSRLGCIGCPMAKQSSRDIEFTRWPRYENKWRDVFRSVWDIRSSKNNVWFGNQFFSGWEAMWEWWREGKDLPDKIVDEDAEEESCQLALDMFSGSDEEAGGNE